MEISERALRQMVRDVDDQNREGMETMAGDIAELHSGEGKTVMETSRRRFVQGIGLGGVTLVIGGAMIPLASLWSPAYAQASTDKAIAQFAESVELAAVAAYQAAAATGKVTGAGLQTAKTFAAHHAAHAKAFGAFAGDTARAKANPKLVAAIAPKIQSAPTETAIVQIAYGLENSAAATYLFAIGALTDPTALKTTASILPVESQHAVVWGQVLGDYPGNDNGTFIPAFLNEDAAVSPSQYPITPGT